MIPTALPASVNKNYPPDQRTLGRGAAVGKQETGDGKWGTAPCVQHEVDVSSRCSNDSKLGRRNCLSRKDKTSEHFTRRCFDV